MKVLIEDIIIFCNYFIYIYVKYLDIYPANQNVYKKLWSLLKIFSCG